MTQAFSVKSRWTKGDISKSNYPQSSCEIVVWAISHLFTQSTEDWALFPERRCFATTTNSFYSVPFNFSLDNNIWPFEDPTFCMDTSYLQFGLAEWFDLGFFLWFSFFLLLLTGCILTPSIELLWHYLLSLLSSYFANQLGTTAVV